MWCFSMYGAQYSQRSLRDADDPSGWNPARVLLALLLAFDAAGAELSATIVQDDSNSPVPSAALRIQNTRGSVVAETETDAQGRFRISLPDDGKDYLGAEKAGYLETRMAVEGGGARVILRLVRRCSKRPVPRRPPPYRWRRQLRCAAASPVRVPPGARSFCCPPDAMRCTSPLPPKTAASPWIPFRRTPGATARLPSGTPGNQACTMGLES